MAQKVQTFLIDDLDGSEAEGTVLFGLDGAQYEIDLSTDHAKELRTALARYIDAGRRVTGTARRAGQNGRKTPASSISNTEVRTWAKAQGLEVKERGRVPADVLAQYRAATASSSTAAPGLGVLCPHSITSSWILKSRAGAGAVTSRHDPGHLQRLQYQPLQSDWR